MNAIVLCAGFATRMAPLTEHFPKPLLPVADRPVIDYLMDQLAGLPKLSAITIVTNDRFFNHFVVRWRREWVQAGGPKVATVSIINDGATDNENRLGAVADLQLAIKQIGERSPLLVSAGDNIYRFQLKPLWDAFVGGDHHRIVAMPETDENRLKKTGVLELAADDRVLRLQEKPQQPASHWFCPPLYFFKESVAAALDDFLAASPNRDAPGHFIAYLCRKQPVYAFRLTASRLDIGSIDTYRQADRLLRKHPI